MFALEDAGSLLIQGRGLLLSIGSQEKCLNVSVDLILWGSFFAKNIVEWKVYLSRREMTQCHSQVVFASQEDPDIWFQAAHL